MATSDSPLSVAASRSLSLTLGPSGGGGSGDISWTGTLAHGQTITVSDVQSRFGARTNVKPLYVNIGDGKAGSSLGRNVGDYYHNTASVTHQTTKKLGQLPGAVLADMAAIDAEVGTPQPIFSLSIAASINPIIHYIERWYDFLGDDPNALNAGALNLKTNRFWAEPGSPTGNSYFAYQFAEGACGNIRALVENPSQTLPNSRFYGTERCFEGLAWQNEEFVVIQSSANDVADGNVIHTVNATKRTTDYGWVTRTTSVPTRYDEINTDQISNGTGADCKIYTGYHVLDDEFSGIYLGNASTLGACTKLVRQPQTAWAAGQVQFQAIESFVPISGAYLYVRTGVNAWVATSGVLLQ